MQVLVDSMSGIENPSEYLEKIEQDFIKQFEMRATAPQGEEVLSGLD